MLVLGNLRGVRAAGSRFAAPTYMFVSAITLVVIVGLVKSAGHGFHPVAPVPHHAAEALGLLLILRAFSSGATAMTGIEVISDAVSEFEAPEADNARSTLPVMVALLVSMFIGVVVVAHLDGAAPGAQTVLSQFAHRRCRRRCPLCVLPDRGQLRDQRLPAVAVLHGARQLCPAHLPAPGRPSRIYGQTGPLIPLFAVGVFVAFTLAQSGMVAHWWSHRDAGWRGRLAIKLIGAVLSGAVAIIAAATKFTAGAWVVVVLIPLIVLACRQIHGAL